MDTEALVEMFFWLWGAVVSFFGFKILGVAKQLNTLHDIYTKTDDSGAYLGYKGNKIDAIVTELHAHVEREEDSFRDMHRKIDALTLKVATLCTKSK